VIPGHYVLLRLTGRTSTQLFDPAKQDAGQKSNRLLSLERAFFLLVVFAGQESIGLGAKRLDCPQFNVKGA
jgi:hypothetical protein